MTAEARWHCRIEIGHSDVLAVFYRTDIIDHPKVQFVGSLTHPYSQFVSPAYAWEEDLKEAGVPESVIETVRDYLEKHATPLS